MKVYDMVKEKYYSLRENFREGFKTEYDGNDVDTLEARLGVISDNLGVITGTVAKKLIPKCLKPYAKALAEQLANYVQK